jgi:beta-lactamase regulating signal transducer with metallopeptidase domain
MSDFILSWNQLATDWAAWVGSAAAHSALILAVVLGIRSVYARRGSAHLGYALLLLPLLPLALPALLSFELPWTHPQALVQDLWAEPAGLDSPSDLPSPASPQAIATAPIAISSSGIISGIPAPSSTSTVAPISAWAWVFLAWILGTGALLIRFAWVQIQTSRIVATSTPLPCDDRARIEQARGKFHGSKNIEILQNAQVGSPAAWGLRRRRILFPPGIIAQLSDPQLAWVLRHEIAHHQRNDLWIGALQRLILIAWFFNPLAWWLNRRLDHLRECACDETARAQTRIDGKACALALLHIAQQPGTSTPPALALQTLHPDKATMQKRIVRLMKPRLQAKAGLAPVTLPLLLLMTGLGLTKLQFTDAKANAQQAVVQAQSWLIGQQLADGHWPTGPGSEKPAGEFNAIGVTALALMSLEQTTDKDLESKRAQAVTRGLKYLHDSLDEPSGMFGGVFGGVQDRYSMPGHALATQAWLRAHRNSTDKSWRKTAKFAIDAILQAQNPYSAWRYEAEPNGDNDSFLTSLMLNTLALAKAQGFGIPEYSIRGGLQYLEEMTDSATGRIGYQEKGSLDERLIGKEKSHPVKFTELYTAAGLLAQAELGATLTDSETALKGIVLIAAKKPVWQDSNQTVDYYYWYFGSKVMSKFGGKLQQSWADSLQAALVSKQLHGAKNAGSWPAVDAWGDAPATIHATAWATLALQASLE